jgi:hypothetical protein
MYLRKINDKNLVLHLTQTSYRRSDFAKSETKFHLRTGVDVIITIFYDFPQFSAKKLAFFLNTNVMIKFFSKFSFVWSQKRQFLAKFFGRRYSKNNNIGPWSRAKNCSHDHKTVTLIGHRFRPCTGLPDFSWYNIPTWGKINQIAIKYTYQRAIKYTKEPEMDQMAV